MAESLHLELHNRAQAWTVIKGQLYPFLDQVLQGGKRWVLTVSLRKRTSKPEGWHACGNVGMEASE